MHNHEPGGYRCPFCRNIRDGESDMPFEVLHRDDDVLVKVNPKWWPNNPGAALVIPVEHHENLYDLPVRLAEPILRATRFTALAMKSAFGCEGVSTRQHNEPAGNQDVWHFHVHVFPRFPDDGLYRFHDEWRWANAEEMRDCADRLRAAWPTVGSA
ncbi:MAG: HIT family protein [Actinomycetota bacterium]